MNSFSLEECYYVNDLNKNKCRTLRVIFHSFFFRYVLRLF